MKTIVFASVVALFSLTAFADQPAATPATGTPAQTAAPVQKAKKHHHKKKAAEKKSEAAK